MSNLNPTQWDHAIIFFLVAVLPLRAVGRFSRFKREVEAGKPGVRSREYRRTMLWQWSFTVFLLLYWFGREHPIEALGLAPPKGWGFWLGLVLVAVIIVALRAQQRAVERFEPARQKVIAQLERLAMLLPSTPSELKLFSAVALTAGICEEILFRGFFLWYLEAYLGLVVAILVSSIVFGAAHAYQGWRNGLRIVPLALILALLYVGTGSLWVPMLLHGLVDFTQGRFAYRLNRSQPA